MANTRQQQSTGHPVGRDDISLGRIAGFPVAMNWSVLLIAWLLTWSLATGGLPEGAPGHSPRTYWAAGFIGAVVFLGSLLAHELAHSVVARRHGIAVRGVTLWLFGGVASLDGEPATPRADLRIAAAGPATSLGLAGAFALIAATLQAVGVAHILVSVTGWLATINLLLGAFNLLPGAPLDGGRVLRAIIWYRRGDRDSAAATAARSGRGIAFALVGLGLLEFLGGAGVGGLWLVFIGWFLLNAANAEAAHVLARQAVRDVRVRDVMVPAATAAPAWLTVDDFITRFALADRRDAWPVEGFDGRVASVVTLKQLRTVSADQRHSTRLAELAVPLAELECTSPDSGLAVLLDHAAFADGAAVVVLKSGHLVGIVTPDDVRRAVDLRTAAGTGSQP